MFVILVYDIKEKRVAKVLKVCRKYLYWVQNSVFEGELTESKFEKLKLELKSIIEETEDSIIIYNSPVKWYSKREIIGKEKGGENLII
ncbi:MAG: CRISPR-associated endonuclease Cas2 [bacterium]|nr:CRISPR-associated endonuclease Cas2 [bacterium]